MDFERNYQVKILSNRIIQHKEFSSAVNNTDKPRLFAESQAIDPWFLSGFTDAEGEFLRNY